MGSRVGRRVGAVALVALCGLPAAAPGAAPAVAPAVSPDTAPAGAPFRRPPPAVLAARRGALLDSIAPGTAVLPSAGVRDLETEYPQDSDFRQNADFYYLTGLEVPDAWLVLRAAPGGRRRAVLFAPEQDPGAARWTGERPSLQQMGRLAGIEDVRPAAEFREAARAGRLPGRAGPLHVPFRPQVEDEELLRRLAFRSGEVVDLAPVLDALRMVKDDFEIRMLRRAAAITTASLAEAAGSVRPGAWEYELEARVEYGFRRRGAERVGFPSIVGSGPNSVVLHYDQSRRRMEAGDVVVVDVGAEYAYYTADVTRTLPVSGSFSARQREIYELVLGAQRAGIAAVEPGNTMADVARAARRHLREHSAGSCGEKGCGAYFIHGVGHWLGLDVHDVGGYGAPFRPGMVLTVEPGIYLPDEELGVRIEDDVLVTPDGHQVLTAGMPKTVEGVEELMAGGGPGRR